MELNRIAPRMHVEAYRSFEVHSPLATHYRNATCAEIECPRHLAGWTSTIDVATAQGKKWAAAIKQSGRHYTVDRSGPGTTVTFRFPAGQRCFQAPHKVPTGRPELYVVRDGDWRGNPTGRMEQARPAEFVERMAENLDNLSAEINKG